MDKVVIRNIMIICAIILLIILIIIFSNKKQNKSENSGDSIVHQGENTGVLEQAPEFKPSIGLQKEDSKTVLFSTKDIIENYISIVNSGNSSAMEELTDLTYDETVSVLGNYLSRFKISEIYSTANENQGVYFVKGNYITIESGVTVENSGYFQITKDFNNNTYNIKPISEEDYNNKQAISEETYIEIAKASYNIYEEVSLNTKAYLTKYLEDFMYFAKNAPQYAYDNLLDITYRDSKFADVDSFIAYINNLNIDINTVSATNYDTYIEYKIYNKDNNVYILREFSNFEYKVILDNYTIPSSQDLETYKSLSDEEKVGYCINNFLEMLNNKDYSSAYAKLPKGYKTNYFETEQSFIQYIETNFYEKNIFAEANVKTQDGVYVATVTIKAGVSTKAQKQEKVFYVQLEENMNYILSFEQ